MIIKFTLKNTDDNIANYTAHTNNKIYSKAKEKITIFYHSNIVYLIELYEYGKVHVGHSSQLLKNRVVQRRRVCSVKENALAYYNIIIP